MLCKQLRQLVAIDGADAKLLFKYATVANIPLPSNKLRAVYRGGDNKESLTSVLNNDVSGSGGGSSDMNSKRKRKHTDVSADVAGDYSNNSGDSHDVQYFSSDTDKNGHHADARYEVMTAAVQYNSNR
jgi:hypothetical protein